MVVSTAARRLVFVAWLLLVFAFQGCSKGPPAVEVSLDGYLVTITKYETRSADDPKYRLRGTATVDGKTLPIQAVTASYLARTGASRFPHVPFGTSGARFGRRRRAARERVSNGV